MPETGARSPTSMRDGVRNSEFGIRNTDHPPPRRNSQFSILNSQCPSALPRRISDFEFRISHPPSPASVLSFEFLVLNSRPPSAVHVGSSDHVGEATCGEGRLIGNRRPRLTPQPQSVAPGLLVYSHSDLGAHAPGSSCRRFAALHHLRSRCYSPVLSARTGRWRAQLDDLKRRVDGWNL